MTWQLLDVIGKGDAGEVLRVKTELGAATGVMKRPVQNVSGGTIVRQATQIEIEGQVLATLEGLDDVRNNLKIHTPLLLDTSITGTSATANLFIVSEEIRGESISDFLKKIHQDAGPISQVLVLKVLAATFRLLNRVHSRGILWNDVKMEHIFWNAPENTLAFIDWGNSLFFDPQNLTEKAHPRLDYDQLISEGGLLLNQTAPELIQEIGWPISASQLTENDITQLQIRLEYMETYLFMRVVEYQLLYRRYLKSITDLDSLAALLDLKTALEDLGVEVDIAAALEAARKLAVGCLCRGEKQAALAVAELLEQRVPASLEICWQLAAYELETFQELPASQLERLVSATLNSNWEAAAWVLQEHAAEEHPRETHLVINAMRKAELNFDTTPGLIIDDLREFRGDLHMRILRLRSNGEPAPGVLDSLVQFATALEKPMDTWESLAPGEMLGDKFVRLRETLGALASAGLELPRGLLMGLTSLLSRTREVYRAWTEGNLAAARKAIEALYLFEPTLVYLPQIHHDLAGVEAWIERLTDGPRGEQTVNQFGAALLETLPPVSKRLGAPPWMENFQMVAETLRDATDLAALRELAARQQWPLVWVNFSSLKLDSRQPSALSTILTQSQRESLERFHKALREYGSALSVLPQLGQTLQSFRYAYSLLSEQFDAAFSVLPLGNSGVSAADFPAQDKDAVEEALFVLECIRGWKTRDHAAAALQPFDVPQKLLDRWRILRDIRTAESLWRKQIIPILGQIKQKNWQALPSGPAPDPLLESLHKANARLLRFNQEWKKIPDQGLYPGLAEDLVLLIEDAQSNFFDFSQNLERSSSAPLSWLARRDQSLFSSINQGLLLMERQLRTLRRAQDVINQPEMARTRLAQNAAGDLMFSLVQLDSLISQPSRKRSVLRDWQKKYLDLLKSGSREAIVAGIQEIESIHPLLPWFDELVRRDMDFFETPTSHKW